MNKLFQTSSMRKTSQKIILSVVLTILFSFAVCMLCACGSGPNADPEQACKALEQNGYTATYITDEASLITIEAFVGYPRESSAALKAVVTATKTVGDATEHVTILYFVNASTANELLNGAKTYSTYKDADYESSDWSFGNSGAVVWFGTNAAIQAAE